MSGRGEIYTALLFRDMIFSVMLGFCGFFLVAVLGQMALPILGDVGGLIVLLSYIEYSFTVKLYIPVLPEVNCL